MEKKSKTRELTVLKWMGESSIAFLGLVVEYLFRLVLLILPLWFFLFLVQSRKKASSVSNISVFTNEKSVWQFIFPGFILVAVEPEGLKNSVNSMHGHFQRWAEKYKHLIALLFMITIVTLLVLMYNGLI